MTTTFNVGDRVRVIDPSGQSEAALGDEGVVTEVIDRRSNPILAVKRDGDDVELMMFPHRFELIADPAPEEPPSRPVIDFSESRYQTARGYVQGLNRADFPLVVQDVIAAIVNAEKVDALDLSQVVAHALRANANRGRDAATRRVRATQLMHLHYIARGALANALDELPAYAEGERSRKVKELEAKVDQLLERERGVREILAQRDEQLTLANRAWETELANAVRANAEIANLEEGLDNQLSAANAARDVALQVLGFALGELDENGVCTERVLGYWDALEPGFRHHHDPEA